MKSGMIHTVGRLKRQGWMKMRRRRRNWVRWGKAARGGLEVTQIGSYVYIIYIHEEYWKQGEEIRYTWTDRETEQVWQIVPWGCFRFYSSTCLPSFPFLPHRHQQQPGFISHSLNLSFSTPHSHVWEDSCAAAAILNYIGQWEIVFAVILCLMFIQKLQSSKNISKSTRECRGEKKCRLIQHTNRHTHAN